MECNCVTGDYSMFIKVLFPHDAGAGSIHQPTASVRQNPDADRLFDARGAPRRARSRTGGEAIKNKKPSPSGEGCRAKRGRMRAKFALFPVNGILPTTRPSSVRFAGSFPRWGKPSVSKDLPLRDRLPRYGGGGACARGGAVPRRGGGREPCHSPKYFGQPFSSLPHRLRAEPPRRGGQGVSTPFSTG